MKTVELRLNKGPGDWQNLFAVTRFRYVEAVFSYILLLLGKRKSCVIPRTSLCRGFFISRFHFILLYVEANPV